MQNKQNDPIESSVLRQAYSNDLISIKKNHIALKNAAGHEFIYLLCCSQTPKNTEWLLISIIVKSIGSLKFEIIFFWAPIVIHRTYTAFILKIELTSTKQNKHLK